MYFQVENVYVYLSVHGDKCVLLFSYNCCGYSENSVVWSAGELDLSYKLAKVIIIKIYENIERKGEIARNEQFLLSLNVFPFILSMNFTLFSHLKWLSLNSFNLKHSKICRLTMAMFPYNRGIGKFVCLGFHAVSTVFQLFNGDSSQIHVSRTVFNRYLASQLS